jgi:hypothetical protein
MIDIEQINKPVDIKDFISLSSTDCPALFLGYVIKNQYDNLRINLNEKYKPMNLIHLTKDKKEVSFFKGIKLQPNNNIKGLFNIIKKQENLTMNLVIYENILSQFNLACKETYAYFTPGVYPIDFNNLKSVCDDSFNTDKKIFQHLLMIDEKVFDFQKFSSLKLFILTV